MSSGDSEEKDVEPERGGSKQEGDRRKASQNGGGLSEDIAPVPERLREEEKNEACRMYMCLFTVNL